MRGSHPTFGRVCAAFFTSEAGVSMTVLRERPQPRSRRPRVQGPAAVSVIGITMLVVVLGSTVPSGLYTIYERDWGLAVATTTLVFATYIVGVLVALVAMGHLSDHLGRKPVMVLAVGLSIGSSVVFVLADSASLL